MEAFTQQEIELFERSIDKAILKGDQQARISTNYNFLSKEMQRFVNYLDQQYPSGSFSKNPNWRFVRIAKNGKKLTKKVA
tara:strand:- start:12206 stop:12445 length:240 start_codon:yes stop_codon:yes gene_type:complete